MIAGAAVVYFVGIRDAHKFVLPLIAVWIITVGFPWSFVLFGYWLYLLRNVPVSLTSKQLVYDSKVVEFDQVERLALDQTRPGNPTLVLHFRGGQMWSIGLTPDVDLSSLRDLLQGARIAGASRDAAL